jgi:hypothetical protein
MRCSKKAYSIASSATAKMVGAVGLVSYGTDNFDIVPIADLSIAAVQGAVDKKFGIEIQSRMPLGLCRTFANLRSSSVFIPTPSCIPSLRPCVTMRSLSAWRAEL